MKNLIELQSLEPKWFACSLLFNKDPDTIMQTVVLVARNEEESIKLALAGLKCIDHVYDGFILTMKQSIKLDLEVSAEYVKEFYEEVN